MAGQPEPSSKGRAWRVAAAGVLAVGLLAATGVWVASDDRGDPPPAGVAAHSLDEAAGAAARDRQDQRLGGPALARTVAFDAWLSSLWHGRRLAVTLVALSAVVAAGCAWIAALADTPPDAD